MRKLVLCQILTIITLIAGAYYSAPLVVQADDESDFVIEREEWFADDRILAGKEDYNFPNKLVIVLLDGKDIPVDSKQSIKELYYYFSTRSGFGDFPFHYLVTSDSKVYSGNKFGDEAKINLGDTEEAVLIAYVQNESKRLTISTVDPFKNIILKVINHYAIEPENIAVKELTYKLGKRAKIEEIELKGSTSGWQDDLEILKQAVAGDYSPSEISFKAEIIDIILPEESLTPADIAEVKIKVKNNGNFNIYSSLGSNIFVAKNNPFDEKSLFYLSEEWSSFSRIALLDDGERLVSGEEKEFSFKIFVPLFPPAKSEEFVLVDPRGNIIEETEFEVAVQISQIEATIIEITDTPVGYLNVRETPGLGEIITKVSPGERFIVKEYESGYYKIDANGKEGWVVNTYAKVVR